ncbi:MAG: DNA recombination protein RmuC [bacterium]
MNATLVAFLAASVVAVLALVWALMERRRASAADTRAWELRERYAETEARMRLFEDQAATSTELLRAQAAQSATTVAEELLKRTDETFRNRELMAQQRMEAQLKPVADTLAKFQEHVAALEKVRSEETGGLKEQLALLMTASTATRDEARRLTEALRGNTGRRGRWGEQTCRNVLEAAGMAGRFDYIEQSSAADEDGRQKRPDFLVRLPGAGMFVIDAKAPLVFPDPGDADDAEREAALATRNAQAIKAHVAALTAKAYQDQFTPSPDFVALFVPSDAFLSAALDREPELMTEAMTKRVIIVTPSTLFALCKAVAYGWRAEEQSRNADEVAKLGKELYKRLSVMGSHAMGLGKSLGLAVDKYNAFVGSLETQVMVSARRFEDLKVDHEGRDLPLAAPVDAAPRALNRPELLADAAQADPQRSVLEVSRDR